MAEKRKKTVVIVDDETDIAMYLETALDDGGFAAHTASSAGEGLALIRRLKPDLVCLDILMPEESGLSLYRKMKSDDRLMGIPVIITSGLSLSRELGHIDYLRLPDGTCLPEPDAVVEKPIEPAAFMEAVKKAIR